MTVLLLCGYRDREVTEKALFYDHIDSQIRQLRWLGLNVVCVLAGAHADDQLRYCRRIADSELVFDTTDHPNLASNLKAGLAGTDGSGCFALPVEVPAPSPEVFAVMREGWRARGFLTETNIYQLITEEGAPSHYGFPLLVTRSGNSTIKQLEGFRSLIDTRLKYSGLASMELPL